MALNIRAISGLVSQARRYAAQNPEAVESGLGRVGDVVNRRTGGKHATKVTKATDAARRALGGRGGSGTTGTSGAGPTGTDPRAPR